MSRYSYRTVLSEGGTVLIVTLYKSENVLYSYVCSRVRVRVPYRTVIWWIFPILFLCTFPIYLM